MEEGYRAEAKPPSLDTADAETKPRTDTTRRWIREETSADKLFKTAFELFVRSGSGPSDGELFGEYSDAGSSGSPVPGDPSPDDVDRRRWVRVRPPREIRLAREAEGRADPAEAVAAGGRRSAGPTGRGRGVRRRRALPHRTSWRSASDRTTR
jgi:hypothetical protein